MDIKHKIIDLIQRNRISSTEIADALGKTGVVDGPKPIGKGHFIVGEVEYIYGHTDSNWPIHEQGKDIEEGKILFIDSFDCEGKALFGDIVSKYFILYKKMKGLVANGLLRDVHVLLKENYPIWCTGYTPLGCFNRDVPLTPELEEKVAARKEIFEGGVLVCDDSGCTLIEKKLLNDATYRSLKFIELQEDIWYYCLDTLKWSTYDTICLKRYLTERDVLPKYLQDKLIEFSL